MKLISHLREMTAFCKVTPKGSHGDNGIQRHLLVIDPPVVEGGQPLLHEGRERGERGLADGGVQVHPLEVG